MIEGAYAALLMTVCLVFFSCLYATGFVVEQISVAIDERKDEELGVSRCALSGAA